MVHSSFLVFIELEFGIELQKKVISNKKAVSETKYYRRFKDIIK